MRGALAKLARKQVRRTDRVGFQRGVQAERRLSKQAKTEKRHSKAARKGQEGQRRRKASAARRASAVPIAATSHREAPPRPAPHGHRSWTRPGYASHP